jgi:hypothetical protein
MKQPASPQWPSSKPMVGQPFASSNRIAHQPLTCTESPVTASCLPLQGRDPGDLRCCRSRGHHKALDFNPPNREIPALGGADRRRADLL